MARKRTRKKNTRRESRKREEEQIIDPRIREEIILIFICLFALLLFLSNLGFCGVLGEVLRQVQFILFGNFGFLFPFLLLFILIYYEKNKEKPCLFKSVMAIVVLYLLTESFFSVLFLGKEIPEDFYSLLQGGGVLGSGVLFLLSLFLGRLAALFVLFFFILLSLVFITEKPLMSLFAVFSVHTAEKAGRRAKEDFRKISDSAKEAFRERRERRTLKGVDFSATDLHIEDFSEEERDEEELRNSVEKYGPESRFVEEVNLLRPDANNFPEKEKTEDFSFDLPLDTSSEKETVLEKKEPEDGESLKERLLKQDRFDHAVETASGGRIASDRENLEKRMQEKKPEELEILKETAPYQFPPLSLLKQSKEKGSNERSEIEKNARTLQDTLKSFGITVSISNVSVGPSVTRYELQPEQGVKLAKIVSLSNDIKMRLAAADIRIEAPIPGKSAVGIEVPNKHSRVVYLGDILTSPEFRENNMKLSFGVGKDIAGKVVVTDIAKMPHLLVAGATGAGKSVSINTLIMSILYKYTPEEVRMIMVDPKVVELQVYNGIPHLLIPVVTDPKKAASALNWAVAEMTNRYKKFANLSVRDLSGYNEKIRKMSKEERERDSLEILPQILIIIDELADLMMVSAQEVEDAIVRLTQLARACGMHLIIATQRPSVNVITGLIKANVPSRIAFSVSSGVDSRTIIDMNGAEKLLGKGDMLFFPQSLPKPIRVQGAFVSDEEVAKVTEFLKSRGEAEYKEDITKSIEQGGSEEASSQTSGDRDELFFEAAEAVIETEKASIGYLQRKFRIGFNRAARIMDQLSEAHIVGEEEGTKARKILMNLEEFDEFLAKERM